MFIPKLLILYGYVLDRERRQLFKLKDLGPYPDFEVIKVQVNKLKELWAKINDQDQIIKKIIDLTGVNLSRDMEAWIIGSGLSPMSHPFIVPISAKNKEIFSEETFVEIIIHEIIHKFVGDQEETPRLEKYWNYLKNDKYKDESSSTRNHVILYAVLKVIIVEFFGRDKLSRYVRMENLPEDYKKAWDLMELEGAENLIAEFVKFTNEKI